MKDTGKMFVYISFVAIMAALAVVAWIVSR